MLTLERAGTPHPARATSSTAGRPTTVPRRTRTPRQACARWVERRVLVPLHDACGSPGRCHVMLAHQPRRAAHAPPLANDPCTSPPRPPYSGHAATHTVAGLNLVPKLPPPPPRASHKSPSFLHVRERQAHRHPPLGAIPVSLCAAQLQCPQARLAIPLAPLVLARPSVDLVGLAARRSQSPRGRRQAAIDELCSPRDPRANQPSQHLH
jgi:hypothetical protein